MSLFFRKEERRIVVFGNTFPVKDQLKALGARFDGGTKSWVLALSDHNEEALTQVGARGVDAPEKSPVSLAPRPIELESTNETGPSLTVSELIARASMAISQSFPEAVWVVGEIHNVSKKARAVFATIAESKNEGSSDVASLEVRTVIWGDTLNQLAVRHGDDLIEQMLQDGTQVRVKCQVALYRDRAQLSLTIVDVDPNYTKGAIARARAELLAELRKKSLDENNKKLEIPAVPLLIGLISSKGSRAYSDFLDQLLVSKYPGRVVFADASTQGDTVSKTVCQAIDTLVARRVDVIFITRGGGSAADLRWFDDRAIAYKIAECPIPIMAAIGHHDDVCVAELIAHSRHKTPTAAAEYICDFMQKLRDRLKNAAIQVAKVLSRRREFEDRLIVQLVMRLKQGLAYNMQAREKLLVEFQHKLPQLLRVEWDALNFQLVSFGHEFRRFFEKQMNHFEQSLWRRESKLNELNPMPWLRQGWTQLRLGKERLLSAKHLRENDVLQARLIDAKLELTVTQIVPRDSVSQDQIGEGES